MRAYFESLERELVRIASYTAGSMIGGGILTGTAFIAIVEGPPWLATVSGLVGLYGLVCGSEGYDDRKAVLDRYASFEQRLLERSSSERTFLNHTNHEPRSRLLFELNRQSQGDHLYAEPKKRSA